MSRRSHHEATMTARISFLPTLALAAGALAACAPTAPPTTARPTGTMPTTLLVRLGVDTIAVEQYMRSADRMVGTVVSRTPAATVARYTVALDARGEPTIAELTVRRGDGTLAPGGLQSITVRFSTDSLHYVGRRASGDTVRTLPAPGPRVPWVNNSYALFELAIARLLTARADSMAFTLAPMNVAARTTIPLPMRRLGGDSVRYTWFGNPFYARHDGSGRTRWFDGRQTTVKARVDRVAAVDLDAIVRAWMAREVAGTTPGPASTRDTARATIGAAQLWVDYGRPSLRGRDVWASGVLGDTLWRTGANAATQLRTNVDLLVGGQSVPAGTYSLWTLAARNGYHLIVNRQAGQWGTEYHPERDLIRVPLQETDIAGSVERFTISVEPQSASAGQLVMAWGGKRLSVPITTR